MATTWDTLAPTYIRRLSEDVGITPEQSAGIFGQLGYESEGLQAINERHPVVPGSRGGFGWAQWTGPRRRAFESWAAENNASITDPETNYQFLLHELRDTPEGRVLDTVRQAPDAVTAGRAFTDGFLRPGVPAYEGRDSWARRAMNFVVPTAQAGTLPENQEMSMSDRIQRARDAGFNDEEILQRIQGNADMSQRIQRARDAGFSDEEIFGRIGLSPAARNETVSQQQDQPQDRSFVQRVGDNLREVPRQVGLTARYGLEGLGQAAGVLTEPLRQGMNVGLRAAGLPEAAPTAGVMSAAADTLGLPTPQGANERVVGDVARLMAGAGGVSGGAQALARGATGATQGALSALAANPGQQVASAMGAGAAGGAVRESGGGPLAQAGAALAGGLAAPMAVSGAQAVGRNIQGRINALMPSQVDDAIAQSLQQAGVDWQRVPERVRQQLRQEAGQALRTGQDLDPAAMARLADFRRVEGAMPTRGMLTQDPGQITREMNLAKQQANTGATGGRNLSQVQADNNAALVRALDAMGANTADDAISASERIMGRLREVDAPRKESVDAAYRAVRNSAGRYENLDTPSFSTLANNALDEKQLGYSLPSEARNLLNDISSGKIPFNVNTATQLDSTLSSIAQGQRSGANPNLRAALATDEVRRALHATPLSSDAGSQSMQLYDRARQLAAARFDTIKQTPALKSALDGKAPDKFVNEFLLGSSEKRATTSHVQALARQLRDDPQAMDAARGQIAAYLKDKAISGLPDDIGAAKFSPTQYAKALRQIGDRKLGAFFDAQEIEQLHAISRVGRLMTNQPVGSAVNNSNTSAALIGRTLDMMGSAGRNVRLLGIGEQIGAIQSGLQQRGAQQIGPALRLPAPDVGVGNRLIPASLYGSLLAAPGIPRREDNRGQ